VTLKHANAAKFDALAADAAPASNDSKRSTACSAVGAVMFRRGDDGLSMSN